MGKEKGTERSEGRSNGSGVTEEGRSPTGVTPGGGSVISGPLENGQRWTIARKREVAIRVMRGESIEMLSRELGVESYRIQEWYERALAGLDAGLRERGGDPLEDQLKRAHALVGELTMMNELYQERLRRIEHRPFDPKRSRK